MTESSWNIAQSGPGRLYQQPKDLVVNEKFDEADSYVATIAHNLKGFLKLETSVRLLLDGPLVHPTVAVISVPFEGEQDTIFTNMATLIYQQLWGYYLAADPKSTHNGFTALVLEGHENALVRRETEKFLDLITTRNELGGRAMRNYRMACDIPPLNRDVYMKQAMEAHLDIHLGVRLYTFGEGVQRKTIFMPVDGGANAIDRIYYNIEHIIHQNLVTYDEVHDHYLPVSEELVARELEGVLSRSLRKDNTRKKIINGLKLHTVMLEDASMNYHISLADFYYDKLNRIDLLDEAAQRSREMFSTALLRSTELTQEAGVNVDEAKMEERVYIERPTTPGEAATVQATVQATAPSTSEQPAAAEEQPEEATATATTHTDGLEEL